MVIYACIIGTAELLRFKLFADAKNYNELHVINLSSSQHSPLFYGIVFFCLSEGVWEVLISS